MKDGLMVLALGPGSQSAGEDGIGLDCMRLPDGMTTYTAPALPDLGEAPAVGPALVLLDRVCTALRDWRPGGSCEDVFDLMRLDAVNRTFIDQVLGEGEVSIAAGESVRVQESVLAGVWRVQKRDGAGNICADGIEIGPLPSVVGSIAFAGAGSRVEEGGPFSVGVMNAPALLTEINGRIAGAEQGGGAPFDAEPYVINLSLLPQTEEDLALLNARLGAGPVRILSRGYGNCRIVSTAVRNIWWVQYFNSQDVLILNTIEITVAPLAACAAPEDIADSSERLGEILRVRQ
jgi:hydrogenase-1 operon protein HyaF